MKLYNTRTNLYEPFNPSSVVKMYVCGITPYASAHLGHVFTFLTYDLLQRRLEDRGCEVQLVRNITDVDEPLYERANETGQDYRELAKNETDLFNQVMDRLNMRPAFAEPRASDYISQMADAVKQLLDQDIAYRLEDDIYFDVDKVMAYGSFFGYSKPLELKIARQRGGDPDREGKRNPDDFLLWKGVTDKDDPAQWETSVGTGRPGWHIECTVMSESLLGSSFDIHGGGNDLIYPHHESEIAQSEALHGTNPAAFWVHVAPILLAGEKMSKSLGNLVFAEELLQDYDVEVIRLALMHYHHRAGGEWVSHLLGEAEKLWQQLLEAGLHACPEEADILLAEVRKALDDDINTLEVIDALHRFIKAVDMTTERGTDAPEGCLKTIRLLGLEA